MIQLRVFFERNRHRIALAAVLATLCIALTVEHSGFGGDQMGEVASMCMAVFDGSALLLLSAVGIAGRRQPQSQPTPWPMNFQVIDAPMRSTGSARDGPTLLQVFRR